MDNNAPLMKAHLKFFVLQDAVENGHPILTLNELDLEEVWLEIKIYSPHGNFHFEYNQLAFPILESVDTKQALSSINAVYNEASKAFGAMLVNDNASEEEVFPIYDYEAQINEVVLNTVPSLRERVQSFSMHVLSKFLQIQPLANLAN